MQNYDFIMLAVLAAATIFGFWKGLAWQIASLASLVVSYFIALRFSDRLAPMISQSAPWNKFVAMLVIYAISSLAIWMLFRVVADLIDRVKLNEFDRQMGALVGLGKGVLWCIAITFFAVTVLGQNQREQIIASRSGRYIVQILDKADAVAPPEVHQVIAPYIQRINERLDPNYQPNPEKDLQDLQQLWKQQAQAAGDGGTTRPAPMSGASWPTPPSGTTPAWPASTASERR